VMKAHKDQLTEQFLLRVEQIDRQFASIFYAIKMLQDFFDDEQVGQGMLHIIRLFEDYTRDYQSLEEVVMLHYDYPDRSNHEIAHRTFIHELEILEDIWAVRKVAKNLFLRMFDEDCDWLKSHVRESDIKIKHYIYQKTQM
jgi:hemerythrin-like metal-binding protein